MYQKNLKLFLREDASAVFEREITIGSRSLNEAERTFEAVITTGADVLRRDARGDFVRASCARSELGSIPGRARRRIRIGGGSVDDILGSVISVTRAGNQVIATVRMSTRQKARGGVPGIKQGIVRGTSLGYTVEEWKDQIEDGKRVRTAVKWTPKELSLSQSRADPRRAYQ